jgi:hypothetical protein
MTRPSPTLRELVQRVRGPLLQIRDEDSVEQRIAPFSECMRGVYQLGLALARDPALRASPEIAELIRDGAALLPRAAGAFHIYVSEVESEFYAPWDGHEWTSVAAGRSAIEFLRELWRGTPILDMLDAFAETDTIDQLFADKAASGFSPVDAAPEGMPRAHWWWWGSRD